MEPGDREESDTYDMILRANAVGKRAVEKPYMAVLEVNRLAFKFTRTRNKLRKRPQKRSLKKSCRVFANKGKRLCHLSARIDLVGNS